jgi:transposase
VVVSSRRGLLRRVADELAGRLRTRAQLRRVEADMVAVLDEPGLSRLAGIPALTAVGAAAILAETGDPRRYDSSSSLARHAGMSPSDNASGAFSGDARISRRSRPGLRLTVWRAVWPMLQFNPVMAARYQAMTQAAGDTAADTSSRQASAAAAAARARRARARVACAASLLRWIYPMIVHGTSWDAAVASGDAACQHAPRCPAEAA